MIKKTSYIIVFLLVFSFNIVFTNSRNEEDTKFFHMTREDVKNQLIKEVWGQGRVWVRAHVDKRSIWSEKSEF